MKFFTLPVLLVISSVVLGKDVLKERTLAFMQDLNSGDSAKIRSYFVPDAHIYHVDRDTFIDLSLDDFIYVAPNFASKKFQEEFYEIKTHGFNNGFAYVDVNFHFFIDGEMAFSGLDHVVWVEKNENFYIQSIHSSRIHITPKLTPSPGSDEPVLQLNNLMNKWHKDVALGLLDDYFSFMDESFYFLGTDPSERWSKEDFYKFCKPYFDKKETWHFIPNWRNWYFSQDGQTAWFEESLDTWMEECRATGVVVKVNGEWKIVHYNLTVLIENEKMDKFIKLRQK